MAEVLDPGGSRHRALAARASTIKRCFPLFGSSVTGVYSIVYSIVDSIAYSIVHSIVYLIVYSNSQKTYKIIRFFGF